MRSGETILPTRTFARAVGRFYGATAKVMGCVVKKRPMWHDLGEMYATGTGATGITGAA
jgi:hypothetical protein